MSNRDFEQFVKSLKSGQEIGLIRLKHFKKVDGAYLRRDFIFPREVKVNGSTVTFLVENWATFKDCLVTTDYKDIVYYEIRKSKEEKRR